MQTQVTYRHTDANPGLSAYAATELSRLDRLHPQILGAHVVLSDREGEKHADVHLDVPGRRFHAHNTGAHHGQAVDRCVDTLTHSLKRFRGQSDPRRAGETWH